MQMPVAMRNSGASHDEGSITSSRALALPPTAAQMANSRRGSTRSGSPSNALVKHPSTKPACTPLVNAAWAKPLNRNSATSAGMIADAENHSAIAATWQTAMIVIDAHNEIRHLTIESRALLDELQTGGVTEAGLPSLVGAVVTRARFSRTSTQVATRVCGTSGRWLRVTAAPMEGGGGHVGVIIEPARSSDLAPILLESYGLTQREEIGRAHV